MGRPERRKDDFTVALLGQELNINALRELDLSVRVADLERDRWAAFSIVELEWITTAQQPEGFEGFTGESLPEQANAELDRRARGEADAE